MDGIAKIIRLAGIYMWQPSAFFGGTRGHPRGTPEDQDASKRHPELPGAPRRLHEQVLNRGSDAAMNSNAKILQILIVDKMFEGRSTNDVNHTRRVQL